MTNNLQESTECSFKSGRTFKKGLPELMLINKRKHAMTVYRMHLNRLLILILFFATVSGTFIFPQTQPAGTKPEKEIQNRNEDKNPGSAALNPENLLGLSPYDIFQILGSPESVYPMRGKLEWQDDVVFYYSTNLYLFFYDNRVWQVRGDYRFEGNILGITAGMEKHKARELLGKPGLEEEGEDIYLNPAKMTRLEKGFPVRMRLIFDQDGRVSDMYLYRGDY